MLYKKLLIPLLLFCYISLHAQPGRLLLVGGGSEKNGVDSWSTAPYKWAGEGKNVAIIGTSTGSLAPYFMQQCGALKAKEFAIDSRDSADSQATYDTLTSYDVIFFRGGDQYDYYRFYKGTKLQEAVLQVYNAGGTICGTSAGMHILSEVVFTAKYGTVYSEETIENPNNFYVTLQHDFLNLSPGFIFDTHFAERARFGRLAGFIANYKLNQGIDIIGIGMDDLTCMTVDENGLGTVYGTGCANVYLAGNTFSLNGTKLLADSINVVQLLHGCTYDFNTRQANFETLDRQINTFGLQETGNYTILASGGNMLDDNEGMLDDLVNKSGSLSDYFLILSEDETQALLFKEKLLALGASKVDFFKIDGQAGTSNELEMFILEAKKVLLLSNSTATFNPFLESSNGILLKGKLKEDGMVSAFVGDDSRYAGKTVVENYYELYAAYYAELTFSKGLGLLEHTVIMPNSFYDTDMFENSASAVPYCMAMDTLKYGIWLTSHNYMKYSPVEGNTLLSGFGDAPVMLLTNLGELTGFSSHTATGSNSYLPRMIAGFERLQLTLLDETNPVILGEVDYSAIDENASKTIFSVSPNPASDFISFQTENKVFEWKITGLSGKTLLMGNGIDGKHTVNVNALSPGLYFIQLNNLETQNISISKFIKY